MINTYFLEKEIERCSWYDLMWFHGEGKPQVPHFPPKKQELLKKRYEKLKKQLDKINNSENSNE